MWILAYFNIFLVQTEVILYTAFDFRDQHKVKINYSLIKEMKEKVLGINPVTRHSNLSVNAKSIHKLAKL